MNQDDVHFIAKKRKYIKYQRNKRLAVLALLCTAILIVWAIIIGLVMRMNGDSATTETDVLVTESVTEQTSVVTSVESSFYFGGETVSLTIPRTAVSEGALVLVSDHLGYKLPTSKPALTTVWGNKSQTYLVANATLSLASEAFLSADKMFCDFCRETSSADYQITMAYSDAEPPICCGEHGTGYAFDVNVYTGAQSYRLAEAQGIYGWIYENCAKYGFVLRYGNDKTAVTGMPHDADHFRYVGAGHAEYMADQGMALEEYIGTLQKHTYGDKHLEFAYGGVNYEIFYVNISDEAESVEIEIPKDVSYTVSGDNVGGVVVTLYK